MRISLEERKAYLEKRPVGGYTICNFGGINILDIVYGIDDYVVFTLFDIPKVHIRKIYYTLGETSRPYFRYGSMRIYLDECMKF